MISISDTNLSETVQDDIVQIEDMDRKNEE